MRLIRGLLLLPARGLRAMVRLFCLAMGVERKARPMDGPGYERYVAEHLKEQGFRNIVHTGATGDFGVDLVAKKHGAHYAVQCKYYARPVSGAAVQEAVAGMAYYRCDRAMVVTNNRLTRGALELAQANDVLVIEHLDPGKPSAADVATPVRVISVAVCAVLSVLILPQVRAGSATRAGVYALVVLGCYLLPRGLLGMLRWLWRRKRDG